MLKEQVLSNLCDMVKEEENHMVVSQAAEMKLKTADAATTKAAEGKGAAIVPLINGFGDNCLSGGIVQRYWDRILELASAEGSNTPKVRWVRQWVRVNGYSALDVNRVSKLRQLMVSRIKHGRAVSRGTQLGVLARPLTRTSRR